MSAKPIQVTTVVTWHACTNPVECKCGHTHHGRTPDNNHALAPQWGLCDEECGCTTLRPYGLGRERRIDALRKGRVQWGHEGRHHGNGSPDCPRELHHHCDDYCEKPTRAEMTKAGVNMPEGGWSSRR